MVEKHPSSLHISNVSTPRVTIEAGAYTSENRGTTSFHLEFRITFFEKHDTLKKLNNTTGDNHDLLLLRNDM